jgi:hypothetical protein
MLIMSIAPPIARVHLAVDSTALTVSEAPRFETEVSLKCEMCQKKLDISQNITLLNSSEDISVIFNPSIIAKRKIMFREQLLPGVCWSERFDFEVVQSMSEILINPSFPLLPKITEPAESGVRTKMYVMHSGILSTCHASCEMQLLRHTLSPLHVSLQLPPYVPSSLLDAGYRWDKAA